MGIFTLAGTQPSNLKNRRRKHYSLKHISCKAQAAQLGYKTAKRQGTRRKQTNILNHGNFHPRRNAAKCSSISCKNRRLFYNIMRDNNYQPLCESQAAQLGYVPEKHGKTRRRLTGTAHCTQHRYYRNAAKCSLNKFKKPPPVL